MAGLPSCLESLPCCSWTEHVGVDAAFCQAVIEGRRRRRQALDVLLLGLFVSGSFLRTGYLRTALHTCRVRASRVSVQADVEVVSGCLLEELPLAEAVTEPAAAA